MYLPLLNGIANMKCKKIYHYLIHNTTGTHNKKIFTIKKNRIIYINRIHIWYWGGNCSHISLRLSDINNTHQGWVYQDINPTANTEYYITDGFFLPDDVNLIFRNGIATATVHMYITLLYCIFDYEV